MGKEECGIVQSNFEMQKSVEQIQDEGVTEYNRKIDDLKTEMQELLSRIGDGHGESDSNSYNRQSALYIALTYMEEPLELKTCEEYAKIISGFRPISKYSNSILVEILKTICAYHSNSGGDFEFGDYQELSSIKGDPYGISTSGSQYFNYALQTMGWKEKLGYCLFLYYDNMISRRDSRRRFSKEFLKMLKSELREPESKERINYEKNKDKNFRTEDDDKREQWRRNFGLLKKIRKPNDLGPKNLIYIYWNACQILVPELTKDDEVGYLDMFPELIKDDDEFRFDQNKRFMEVGYLEWRLRVDTAWRLFYVLTNRLPIRFLFPIEKKAKRKLNNKIKTIIEIISEVQDENIRMLLIDILNQFLRNQNKVKPYYSILDDFIYQFNRFLNVEKDWEEIRKNIFIEEKHWECLDIVMNRSFVAEVDRCTDLYGNAIIPYSDNDRIYPLLTVMKYYKKFEYEFSEDKNKDKFKKDSLLNLFSFPMIIDEVFKLIELIQENEKQENAKQENAKQENAKQENEEQENEEQENENPRIKASLFTQIWKICHDKVPDNKIISK